MQGRLLYDQRQLAITIERLCCELIENYGDFNDVAIIGIQPRGIALASRIHKILEKETHRSILYGELDATFHRDDFRTSDKLLKASQTDLNFLVEDIRVLFVDDVLYTGRTIRSAMDALLSFGRPRQVELLCLIDRRFNRELPIQPDYSGISVDTLDASVVRVVWGIEGEPDAVWIEKEND